MELPCVLWLPFKRPDGKAGILVNGLFCLGGPRACWHLDFGQGMGKMFYVVL